MAEEFCAPGPAGAAVDPEPPGGGTVAPSNSVRADASH